MARSFSKIPSNPLRQQNFGYKLTVRPSEHVAIETIDEKNVATEGVLYCAIEVHVQQV